MRRFIVAFIIAATSSVYSADGFAMRTMEFLEKYDLSELKYTRMYSVKCGDGTMTRATILDPERLPHEVRVGNYVGKDFGIVIKIADDYIELMEVYQNDAGEWTERRAVLPKVEGQGPRARYNYEKGHALDLLGNMDEAGKKLKEQLIKCRQLFGEDAKRLACFDAAIGTLF